MFLADHISVAYAARSSFLCPTAPNTKVISRLAWRSAGDAALPFLDVTLVSHHSSKGWINTLIDCADISRTPGALTPEGIG